MDVGIIFLRTILIYFVVFIMLRIMGKREIGKLSLFDLVISIMIAEIAVFVLEDSAKPLISGLVPMLTLVLIQLGMAYLTLKSERIRRLFDGKPSVLINKGKLDREEMKKQRYNLDDLIVQLRQQSVMNVGDVEFAILEPSGKLSVFEKQNRRKKEERERTDSSSPKIRYAGLPIPLIMDGKVQDGNLAEIGQTRFWLKKELQDKGIEDFKDVFYCSLDHKGHLYIDRKKHL